jgi:hypothetical protein
MTDLATGMRKVKNKATIMEMKWLLHEKIQLYIYKPSINR